MHQEVPCERQDSNCIDPPSGRRRLCFSMLTVESTEEAVAVDELVITSEPESCVYGGPTTIKQGRLTVVFDNRTGNNVLYNIFLLPKGKSWQDVVDACGQGTKTAGMPGWGILQSGKTDLQDYQKKVYNLAPGSYAVTCAEMLQTGRLQDHLGSRLEVR
jgi:hypothetical protein